MAHSLEQKTVNLTISLLWVLTCAIVLIVSSLNAELSSAEAVSPPITFLLALPALWGMYIWRRNSLTDALTPSSKDSSNMLTESNRSPLPFQIFDGLSPITQLTWLAQSLASICLMLIIVATMRPILLACLIAVLLIVLELSIFAVYFSNHSRTIANSPTPATAHSAASTAEPHFTPATSPATATVHTNDGDIVHDDDYQTLLSLREQIEQTSTESSMDTDEPTSPRQTIRDFRDPAGFGTISGESLILIPQESSTTIVTLAFMPPFLSSPELLADCEDDRVDSVRILQCQPLGAKIEIKFNREAAQESTGDVTLLWEAMLEKM
jgi:hypothetical protein